MTPTNIPVIASLPHHAGLTVFYSLHYRMLYTVQESVPP